MVPSIIYKIFFFLLHTYTSGKCQSPKPTHKHSDSIEQQSEFLYGRAVCERFNENMTSSQVVVCDDGYKDCFTTATISKRGRVHVIAKGCWLFPSSEEGRCNKRACLFGIRENVGRETKRTCCCRGFRCNKNSTFVQRILFLQSSPTVSAALPSRLPAREHKTPRTSDVRPKETIIFGVISSVFATCLILSIVFVSWRCAARKNKSLLSSATQYGDKAAEETLEFSSLNTDEITFKELVRKGKFSSLWNAEYGGRKVIFKIYKQGYHSKWRNEMKIYNMIGPHPNVLEFLDGVELIGCKPGKAIILAYHPNGSLSHYLKSNALNWLSMFNMVYSLASGVAYIHGEIDEYDYLRRRVIVHRNLNSSNVLLRNDGVCVIADFETAVRVTGKQVLPMAEGASIRYMPPEVLCSEVNWNDWESSLKQADLYSLGLIFWEIVCKCADFYSYGEELPEATLPYQNELGSNPSIAQMVEYTVKERKRPVFPQSMGLSDKSDSLLRSTIEECWDTEPEARLTALCVVKRMQEVQSIKNYTEDSRSDSIPFVEISRTNSAGLRMPSDREIPSTEHISVDSFPHTDYNFHLPSEHACTDESYLKERLINSDKGNVMYSEEC